MSRLRCAANMTSSNLFGIFSTQSSTVTRAIIRLLQFSAMKRAGNICLRHSGIQEYSRRFGLSLDEPAQLPGGLPPKGCGATGLQRARRRTKYLRIQKQVDKQTNYT